MIFATAKSLRKLDDAGLKRSASTWRYALERAMVLAGAPTVVIALACLTALAIGPSAPFFVSGIILSSNLAFALTVRLMAGHNVRGLEREIGARARAAQDQAEAMADWLPPPAPPSPSPMRDLGHDFHNGTDRELGVKPALKLKTPAPPDARPR